MISNEISGRKNKIMVDFGEPYPYGPGSFGEPYPYEPGQVWTEDEALVHISLFPPQMHRRYFRHVYGWFKTILSHRHDRVFHQERKRIVGSDMRFMAKGGRGLQELTMRDVLDYALDAERTDLADLLLAEGVSLGPHYPRLFFYYGQPEVVAWLIPRMPDEELAKQDPTPCGGLIRAGHIGLMRRLLESLPGEKLGEEGWPHLANYILWPKVSAEQAQHCPAEESLIIGRRKMAVVKGLAQVLPDDLIVHVLKAT